MTYINNKRLVYSSTHTNIRNYVKFLMTKSFHFGNFLGIDDQKFT